MYVFPRVFYMIVYYDTKNKTSSPLFYLCKMVSHRYSDDTLFIIYTPMTLRSMLQSLVQTIENIILAIYRAIVGTIRAIVVACRAIILFIALSIRLMFRGFIILLLTLCALGISS